MKITQDEVKHVAKLARLQLNQQEVEMYTGQLDAILNAFQKLSEVAIKPSETTSSKPELPLREDFVVPPLSHQEVFQNAPAQEQGGFAVPKIVEK